MFEQWKTIPSMPTHMASSLGRIMAKRRQVGSRFYGGEPTFGQWDGTRYIYPSGGTTYKVARLVCEAFNGPAAAGEVCMHIDENSRNNRPENLQWGTQRENLNAPGFIAYCQSRTGDSSPVVKGRRAKAATA